MVVRERRRKKRKTSRRTRYNTRRQNRVRKRQSKRVKKRHSKRVKKHMHKTNKMNRKKYKKTTRRERLNQEGGSCCGGNPCKSGVRSSKVIPGPGNLKEAQGTESMRAQRNLRDQAAQGNRAARLRSSSSKSRPVTKEYVSDKAKGIIQRCNENHQMIERRLLRTQTPGGRKSAQDALSVNAQVTRILSLIHVITLKETECEGSYITQMLDYFNKYIDQNVEQWLLSQGGFDSTNWITKNDEILEFVNRFIDSCGLNQDEIRQEAKLVREQSQTAD